MSPPKTQPATLQLSRFFVFVFYHSSAFDISMNFCNFAKKYFCHMMKPYIIVQVSMDARTWLQFSPDWIQTFSPPTPVDGYEKDGQNNSG